MIYVLITSLYMLCLYVNSSLVKYETGTVFMGSDLDRIRFFPEQIHCNSSTYTSSLKGTLHAGCDAVHCSQSDARM